MSDIQGGILKPVPLAARFLFLQLTPAADPARGLRALNAIVDGDRIVAGVGMPLVQALAAQVPGLSVFPACSGAAVSVPSTPTALWLWLRGDDRGELVLRSQQVVAALAADFQQTRIIDAFRFDSGRDLTGYEDGTENPEGAAALAAAFVQGRGEGLDGSSFVAVQQWLHDFRAFNAMSPAHQDDCFGRRRSDNEELDDAPASAHVKRTAQESFTPEAFVLRRSMPWAEAEQAGLVFTAFGKSTDAFAAMLNRMVGAEDGVVDALFRFTRPLTGCYFWCPPLRDGRLDLRQLGL
jgi:putative iron-dependent peroxidase